MVKRIIGIDPGSYCTGYGIIEIVDSKIICINRGCIKTNSNYFFHRLQIIYLEILNILLNFKPENLVIEKSYIYKNYSSIIRLNQVSGVIILAAINNFISIFEYSVTKIRKCIVNKGNVDKKYINSIICKLFKIKELNLNITDALAVAVAHSNYLNTLK